MSIQSIRIVFLSALLIYIIVPAMSQEPVEIQRSENKIVLEGKVYYVHVVKAGQTLYSIARAYNVTRKEIVIENPGVTSELRIGQVLKIPFKPESGFDVDTGEENLAHAAHTIARGETIYSISRQYKVPVDELVRLNPGMDINDIPVGTKIKLPAADSLKNELSYDEEGFILHKVKKGETLYSISRYYDVSFREIKAMNPDLQWGIVRKGDVIRIPQSNATVVEVMVPDTIPESAELMEDTVAEFETYTYNELDDFTAGPPGVIRVAYMIPFNYEEMEPLDSLLKNVKSPLRIARITEEYEIEKGTPKSVSFLEFLEGSLLALDSLSQSGPYIDIHVYDTKRSMHQTREILSKPEMKDMDLIIGPFYAFNLELVSAFSKKYKIPVVTPFHSNDSLLLQNPYLFQVTPSFKSEYERNSEYIGRLYDKNLIFVHDGDSSDISNINQYKSYLFREFQKFGADETVVFKEVIISNGDTHELVHALNPDKENLVILPTIDEAYASQVATTLYFQLDSADIELFGSSYWLGFKNIEIAYIHALRLVISNCYRLDYTDSKLLQFMRAYRENYFREPEAITRRGTYFAIAGYDISMYFISAYQRYGKHFLLRMNEFRTDQTLCEYRFKTVGPLSGYENMKMNYYIFDEGLQVRTTSLPVLPPLHNYMLPASDDALYYLWPKPQPDSVDVPQINQEEGLQ